MHPTICTLLAIGLALACTSRAHAQDKPATTAPTQEALPPNPRTFDITRVRGGVDVPYLVTFPPNYKPGPAYPVLIYFGDGRQDQDAVLAQLGQWEKEAAKRRWVLVGVAHPTGNASNFLTMTAEAWTGVLDEIARILPAEDGKFYLAGTGEGGQTALYLGGLVPARVRAVAALNAGADDGTIGITLGLKDTPIKLIYNSADPKLKQEIDRTKAALEKAGSREVHLCPMGPDTKPDWYAQMMFGFLPHVARQRGDALAAKAQPADLNKVKVELSQIESIAQILDSLHDAAAKADEARYFDLYAPNAVFLGTDAKERWTLDEFKAFAHPYFAKGKAWTYTPVKDGRFVLVEGENQDVAWFDEKLENAKLGLCRGSGVLIRTAGGWKIKQYNLTMLVPNEIAEDVARQSRDVK
jgi:pimeloyl-ACP methyl ester carboxylesterase